MRAYRTQKARRRVGPEHASLRRGSPHLRRSRYGRARKENRPMNKWTVSIVTLCGSLAVLTVTLVNAQQQTTSATPATQAQTQAQTQPQTEDQAVAEITRQNP